MRQRMICMLVVSCLALRLQARAQQAESQSTSCNFEDGNQITVQYNTSDSSKDQPRNGKIWAPGGKPMVLYTQVPLTLNGATIPVGAFSMYVLPGKKDWTLIVNKNVTAGSAYDEKDDIARGPMELGEIGQPMKELQVSFAHMAPKQCNIRIYYGKVGAFGEIDEK